MTTLNRTGSTKTAGAPTPYAAIEVREPLPPGEQDAFFVAFWGDIVEPLGLQTYSEEWWRAYQIARRAWLGCLEHGWKVGRREAQEAMSR